MNKPLDFPEWHKKNQIEECACDFQYFSLTSFYTNDVSKACSVCIHAYAEYRVKEATGGGFVVDKDLFAWMVDYVGELLGEWNWKKCGISKYEDHYNRLEQHFKAALAIRDGQPLPEYKDQP